MSKNIQQAAPTVSLRTTRRSAQAKKRGAATSPPAVEDTPAIAPKKPSKRAKTKKATSPPSPPPVDTAAEEIAELKAQVARLKAASQVQPTGGLPQHAAEQPFYDPVLALGPTTATSRPSASPMYPPGLPIPTPVPRHPLNSPLPAPHARTAELAQQPAAHAGIAASLAPSPAPQVPAVLAQSSTFAGYLDQEDPSASA